MSIPGSASPLFFTAAADAAAFTLEKSVRFNSGDSAYLNRTPSSAGSNTTWTLSTWVKKTGNDAHIFGAGAGNTPGRFGLTFDGSDKINVFVVDSGSTVYSQNSDAVFRDPSAWYHIVVIADTTNSTAADRLIVYVNGVRQTLSGGAMPSSQNTFVNTTAAHTFGRRSYTASDYFNGYLASTILVDGTAKDATDFGAFDDNGVWQAAAYSGSFGTNGFHLFNFANESGIGNDSSGNDNDWTVNNLTPITTLNTTGVTTTVPEDLTGDWLGILNVTPTDTNGPVAVFPDGSGVSNTRGTFFWSGLTSGDTITWYGTSSGQNRQVTGDVDESTVDVPGGTLGSFTLTVNAASGSAKIDFNGSANCYGITPGVTTSLPFDVLFDVPTNGTQSDTGAGGEVSGNYPTWNPLDKNTNITLSNGNLDAAETSGANHFAGRATFKYPATGKWYYEATVKTLGGACCVGVDNSGLANPSLSNSGVYLILVNSSNNVQRYIGSSYTSFDSAYGNPTVGSVLQVAYDADADKLWLGMNNVWMGSGSSANGNPGAGSEATASNVSDPFPSVNLVTSALSVNFGQRPFTYSAPSGFKALCTTNLPDPTIADGSDHFDAKLWTGNGSTQNITGYSFSPDLVWTKQRNSAGFHALFDPIRGVYNALRTHSTGGTYTDNGLLTAFNSDGFSVGSAGDINSNNNTYVGWAWDAGSSTVSNTDGSVTSQVRVNQTAGFSIVSWTSSSTSGNYDSIGHSLNALPGLVLTKRLTIADSWYSAHGFDLTQFGKLNSTDAFSTAGAAWGNGHTSSVIGMRVGNFVGANEAMIAYCFAPVAGYSAFGSYEGNGSNDGVFVHTGFSVRWLLTKAIPSAINLL